MKTANQNFMAGAIYLFHTGSEDCPCKTSLWGVFLSRTEDGKTIRLGAATRNMRQFLWRDLPSGYAYCRPATDGEQRLFTASLAAALRSIRQWEERDAKPITI